MRQADTQHYPFDAVIVLGGNIRHTPTGFASATYDDSDQYGMLGGRIRIIAAAWLYLDGQASAFVFSTGTSEKTKAKYGANVPTEARIYCDEFNALLDELRADHPEMAGLEPPTIILEERSQNTVGNIRECFDIIRENQWKKVAILSARHHLPRTEALCGLIGENEPVDASLAFLSAEEIVRQHCPGKYDAEIEAAYNSPEGKKRLAIEAQGVRDIQNGVYILSEFQLSSQRS
jgi:uncharacterized SAM-binding protein YcdF (DUF218 family)